MTELAIEHLTKRAFQASQEGRWDIVAKCYAEREALGQLESLSPDSVQKLIELDRRVMRRIHEVKAAIQQDLTSLQHHRRRLSHLKNQWVGKREALGRHLQTV